MPTTESRPTLPRVDYAARTLRVLGIDGTAHDVLDALSGSDGLNAYWSSLWIGPDGVLAQRFRITMTSFLASQRESLRRYLHHDLGYPEITESFVRHVMSLNQTPADVGACMIELAPGRDVVRAYATDVLAACLRVGDCLRILGFGADDCSFEEDIGHSAITRGTARSFAVYRDDPFAAPYRHATAVTPVQLRDPDIDLTVDIVTCRWALHHVDPSARWGDLQWCLRRLRPGSHLIAVEEGDFAARNDVAVPHRLYRFLVMSVDVVVKTALRPGWFASTATPIGADFHVDFLDDADLVEIERGFRYPFRRTVHPVEAGARFGQTVIAWHVDH